MTEHINNIGEYPSENDIMKALTDRHGIEGRRSSMLQRYVYVAWADLVPILQLCLQEQE